MEMILAHTVNDLEPIMPEPAGMAFFDAWVDEKAKLISQYNCTAEELDEALDAWLDAAKESDHSQHDGWGEW